MNKAFTKEDDGVEDDLDPFVDALPPGEKNYISPAGAKAFADRLAEAHARLAALRQESPGVGADSTPEIRAFERKIVRLALRMETFVVVDPVHPPERVQFGSRVRFVDEEGREQRIEIVGVDEADVAQRRLSWVSPLARALLGAQVGEIVAFTSPRGEQSLEVLEIE